MGYTSLFTMHHTKPTKTTGHAEPLPTKEVKPCSHQTIQVTCKAGVTPSSYQSQAAVVTPSHTSHVYSRGTPSSYQSREAVVVTPNLLIIVEEAGVTPKFYQSRKAGVIPNLLTIAE